MKKRNIVFAVLAILAIAAIAVATVPPPPVDQKIGMNDSRFDKLGSSVQMPNQSGCRVCHGGTGTNYGGTQYTSTGLPDRHHSLIQNGAINPVTGAVYGCNNCHPVYAGPNGNQALIDRECLDCHVGLNLSRMNPLPAISGETANAKVNITRPHHIKTSQAAARDCKYCHGSYVANTFDNHYVPTYAPSLVTPEPHYKVYNATSGRYWGGCWACHQNTTANIPEILAQYYTHHGALSGRRVTGSPNLDHQGDSTPGRECNWCHTVNESGRPIGYPSELDMEIRNASSTTDPVNGTGCEKCHDVGTLHNIQVGFVAGGNGPAGQGHINNNADCNGCHAFWDAGDVSGYEGAMVPNVESTSPAKVSTADTATTLTITGTDFLSGAGTYTAVVSIDGTTTLTPSSVTDTEIVVSVPQLSEGVHTVRVVKQGDPAGDKVGRLNTLVVAEPLDVVSATKAKVGNGKSAQTQITINGNGFGPQPDNAFPELGASVTTTTYNKKGQPTGTVTYQLTITSWSDTEIVGTVKSAASGNPVTVTALGGTDTVNIS